MSSSDNSFCNVSESGPITENTVYSGVITKLRSLEEKSDNKEYHKHIFNDGAKYMKELIVIIEKNKDNTMDRKTALSIEDGFKAFLKALVKIEIKELFENDSVTAYEIFYLYIHLFNLTGMKNYFKRVQVQIFVNLLYEESISIILQVIAFTVAYCKFTLADLEKPLNNQPLLLLMLNFLKDELEPDSSITYSTVSQLILSFIWNYADKTVLIPNLIKIGYPEAILKWLSIIDRPDDEIQIQKSKSNAIRPSISIIHNISRHDDGINVLNSLNAINIIKRVQGSTKNSEINILCCMILALLSTPEQIKKDRKHMNNALDQLLQTVSNATKSKDYKDGGFHISEPLVVLVKLFNDDRALDYILEHAQVELDASSTVDFFINLLLKFNENVSTEKDPLKQLTCTAIVNILWSVSFQDNHQYKRQIKTNQHLMEFIEQLSKNEVRNETINDNTQYVPKYIESIQTAANGILLNITEKTSIINSPNQSILSPSQIFTKSVDALLIQPSIVESTDSKPMIMISYSHDDKALCYQLEEELKRNDQFEIWIDKNYCTTGDSWEHIARGIKQSQVVLCLITKNYTSKSVRREVIYAIDRLDKPLLPVFVLKPNLPEWLDIRTCDLTHVRLADEKQLERSKVSKVIETLQRLISGTTGAAAAAGGGGDSAPTHYEQNTHYEQTTPVAQIVDEVTIEDHNEPPADLHTITPRTDLSYKSVQQWNKNDIKQWWQDNGIILELYDLFQFTDGSELLSYAKTLSEDEKTHYKTYAEEFNKLYNGKTLLLHQFNRFVNALRKLLNEQDQNKELKFQPIHYTPPPARSQSCQIL